MIDRRTILGMLVTAIPAAAFAKPAMAVLTVYKSPYCSCCSGWIDHVKADGFAVRLLDVQDVTPIARKLRVPDALRSCHTCRIGDYFVEGHVPAADIRKLLRERPDARGIAVPGMPMGSPGMEQGDRRDAFSTLMVSRTGKATVFARHNQPRPR